MDQDAPNPTNRGACASHIAWSTSNTAEALPGVATPFTWSYFGDGVEAGMRAAHHDLGALRSSERAVPERAEGRFWDCFYGRTAGNVDTARMLADRLPGTSANAYEEALFGQVRPGMQNHPDHRRLPVVAVMLPYQIAVIGRRERAMSADVQAWWRRVTGPGAPVDRPGARALMLEAADRLRAAMRPHVVATLLCEVFYGQVRQLAAKAGRPGLEISLCTGYGDMAETAVAADLWSVSRDRLPLAEFLLRHGFHGPGEGETSNPSWRLDPAPLQPILAGYRQLGEDRDPRAVETNRARDRLEAERELLASLPRSRRPGARLVLKQAARIIPLRGVGKAAFLRCIDAQRTAAGAYARTLVEDGQLDRPGDIFFLTIHELTAPTLPADCRALVAERRELFEDYSRTELPEMFEGVPTRVPIAVSVSMPVGGEARTELTGVPVSPGTVTGIARVVTDPACSEIEPDEVLVCRTTDPGWASLMMLASALVIDIGGPMSHGAIVARELGIPCVIGTADGSRVIRTGDRVTVDGRSGCVAVLENDNGTRSAQWT